MTFESVLRTSCQIVLCTGQDATLILRYTVVVYAPAEREQYESHLQFSGQSLFRLRREARGFAHLRCKATHPSVEKADSAVCHSFPEP
jgi:hypothetical protein